jgi:hypothetical protein
MPAIAKPIGRCFFVIAVALAISGCRPYASTPPGAGIVSSTGTGFNFTFLKWNEGLRLLLVDDVKGSHHAGGSGSSSDPVYTARGASGVEGQGGYHWQIGSKDGKSGNFRLNGKEYDLAKGALFVIKANGNEIEVHQFDRDLSAIPHDANKCREHLEKDAEVQKILAVAAPK